MKGTLFDMLLKWVVFQLTCFNYYFLNWRNFRTSKIMNKGSICKFVALTSSFSQKKIRYFPSPIYQVFALTKLNFTRTNTD